MNIRNFFLWRGVVFIFLVSLAFIVFYFSKAPETSTGRDDYGCEVSLGYEWSKEAGACVRLEEMTDDIIRASGVATQSMGKIFGLTVVSFNSYEEVGSYDIVIQKINGDKKTIYIRNWQVEAPRVIELFYYDPNNDLDSEGNIKCSKDGLVSVKREIAVSSTPIQDTIRLLLLGEISENEKKQGITSEYPLSGFSLDEVNLKNGVLTLKFNDPENKTSGGSCRVSILWLQIEATAKQFVEVKSAQFMPPELFQP